MIQKIDIFWPAEVSTSRSSLSFVISASVWFCELSVKFWVVLEVICVEFWDGEGVLCVEISVDFWVGLIVVVGFSKIIGYY